MQTIRNKRLEVCVRDKGAELCSIVSLENGKEFMWNGDPSVWESFAPVLFPIIGSLKDGEYLYRGKKYSVPKHGFIRNNENLAMERIGEDCVQYSLKYDTQSLENYPFQFEFTVRYCLQENAILVQHEVINHDKEESMYFSLGGHPAFRCPLNERESYEDYYLEFEQPETATTWEVLSSGLIGPNTTPLLNDTTILPLHSRLFDKDALILKQHNSQKVTLRSSRSDASVAVEYAGFPYLGIWAKPGGDFVCIEPWLGISDAYNTDQNFETKEGIICLEPCDRFFADYRIVINPGSV